MIQIQREPDDVATAIRDYLWENDDLLNDDFTTHEETAHPLHGQCYVASEAYYHLTGGKDEWKPQFIEVNWGGFDGNYVCPHWFLESRDGSRVVDLTVEQFSQNDIEVPHHDSVGRGFVPPSPSGRAKEVMQAVEDDY